MKTYMSNLYLDIFITTADSFGKLGSIPQIYYTVHDTLQFELSYCKVIKDHMDLIKMRNDL